MSYESEAAKVGRIPAVFVEVDMDSCANDYGTAPCSAALGVTGTRKCFKTYGTCQDKPNFSKTVKTYRFCEVGRADIPVGIHAIPLIKSVSYASQEITPGKGLGVRATTTIRLIDAEWPDIEIDPYWRERDYDTNRGSFCGKFKARNRFFEGRPLRVLEGFITHPFSWDNFRVSAWVIDQLRGILNGDEWELVGQDILALADDKKAQFPPPSPGVLAADITDSDGSLTLAPAGIGDGYPYPVSGKVNISGEIMAFTRVGDVMTLTRAQSNTPAAAHDAGDTVQVVGIISNEFVQNAIYKLLTEAAPIATTYINKPAWDAEREENLAGVWSAEIPEPTGVNTLVSELMEQGTCRVWWDQYAQLIQFSAVKPLPDGLPVLTDEEHFWRGLDVKSDSKLRIGSVLVAFAQFKPTGSLDDLSNYQIRELTPNTEAISALEYGSNPVKTVYSRWFKRTSFGRVAALQDALLKTYRDPPQVLTFKLDAYLGITVGSLFYAKTRKYQDETGLPALLPVEVLSAQPEQSGAVVSYKAQQVSTAIPIGNDRTIYISSDTFDFNTYQAYVDEYGDPEDGIRVTFIVMSGIVVSATSPAVDAFVHPADWPSGIALKLINRGVIGGCPGAGGDGANVYSGSYSSPTDGGDGGPGMKVEHPLEIDNSMGVIGAGGGGGGGGGIVIVNPPLPRAGASGGGGGGGACRGPGGLGGAFPSRPDAEDGDTATAATGGNGGYGRSESGAVTAASRGGRGGDLGDAGEDGYYDTSVGTGIPIRGLGGDPGPYALTGDVHVTWLGTGTILGNVI